MPISQFSKESLHCTREVISHISKFFVFSMLRINSIDFSLNRLNCWFLSKSAISDSRLGCVSNWWISFLSVSLRMSSSFWTVECGGPCILKSFLPHQVSPNSLSPRVSPYSSHSLLWWSTDGLASKLEESWRPWCKFGLSAALCGNLGDWYTLLYNSSPDFMYSTFSMHIAGWIVIKDVCVGSCLIELQCNLQITPIYSKFDVFPMIFVHCKSGIRQVVLDFFCADRRTLGLRLWRTPHASLSWYFTHPDSTQTGW